MALVIGIDLGTTNSCAAIYKNGRVEILENDLGKRTTPSAVYYTDNGVIVGEQAINLSAVHPGNGIYDVKRLIGRKYNEVQKNKLLYWNFKIVKEHRDEPLIEIELNGKKSHLRPEEVSAQVLKKLKNNASKRLGQPVKDVIITVPAYFTNPQRKATEDAAKIAGLNVLKLINEPTAAALAFAESVEKVNNKTVLVYDLGGGTFDVSIIKFKNSEGQVIAIDGDSQLGGKDFDINLVKYCTSKIHERFNYSLVEEKEQTKLRHGMRRITAKCEQIKKELSEAYETTFEILAFNGHDVEFSVTRKDFEEMNEKLFRQTIQIVDNLLKESNIGKDKIDEVVVVGGSTKIPRVQQLIREYFDNKPLNQRVNPDEAVAIGAAIEAAYYSNNPLQISHFWKLTDITPFSIGIQIPDSGNGRTMSVILKKNSKLPNIEERIYKTIKDNQTEIDLNIFEGEHPNVKYNVFLGHLNISGITPKRAGKVDVIVKLKVDLNGVLEITATETSNNNQDSLKIELENARLKHEEIIKLRGENY